MTNVKARKPTNAEVAVSEPTKEVVITFKVGKEAQAFVLPSAESLLIALAILQKVVHLHRSETHAAPSLTATEFEHLPRLAPAEISASAIGHRIVLAARLTPACVVPIELSTETAEGLLLALSTIVARVKDGPGTRH
jgi:hypothetical protein